MTSFNLTLNFADEQAHNTAANSAYDEINFKANFSGLTWITQLGESQTVNSTLSDDSYNPVTPVHVSSESIHTLTPGYNGKHIFHFEPYDFGGNHINIGINTNTASWVQSALQDIQNRGYDGILVDWYGPNRYEDWVTLLVKAQVATMKNFTFALMIDTSGGSYSTTAELESYVAYIKSTYFPSPQYRLYNGKPIVYMWGTPVPGVSYSSVDSSMYRITQGLSIYSWTDANFDWVQPYLNGVSTTDPYNLTAKQTFIDGVKNSSKGCVLSVSARFNGYLTKSVAWSKGKMMPGDNGKCWLAHTGLVAANLLSNQVEILTVTYNDEEEGTGLMNSIDNGIIITSSLSGTNLSWTVTGGTGDTSTIAYFSIFAQSVGVKPFDTALLGTVNAGEPETFDLSTITGWLSGNYQLYVVAVGKPNFKNQVSEPVPYSYIQTFTGTFTGSFSGTFTGTFTPEV